MIIIPKIIFLINNPIKTNNSPMKLIDPGKLIFAKVNNKNKNEKRA